MAGKNADDGRDIFDKVFESETYQRTVRPALYGAAGGYGFVAGARKLEKMMRKKKNPLPRLEREANKAKLVGAAAGGAGGAILGRVTEQLKERNDRVRETKKKM